MPAAYNLTFGGEELVLGSDRTVWWPRRKILFATDLHAGKTEHMRLHGLAIPGGGLQDDLQSLQAAATRLSADRLIFLGDLFHSEINAEWDCFADWCRAQPYRVELVRGNHDRFLTDDQFRAAGLQVHNEPYVAAPFSLRHHPASQPGNDAYVLAGHVHPVCWMHGAGKDRLRVRCFWVQPRQLVLPAYGSFTGGYVITRQAGEKLYACSPDGRAIFAA